MRAPKLQVDDLMDEECRDIVKQVDDIMASYRNDPAKLRSKLFDEIEAVLAQWHLDH